MCRFLLNCCACRSSPTFNCPFFSFCQTPFGHPSSRPLLNLCGQLDHTIIFHRQLVCKSLTPIMIEPQHVRVFRHVVAHVLVIERYIGIVRENLGSLSFGIPHSHFMEIGTSSIIHLVGFVNGFGPRFNFCPFAPTGVPIHSPLGVGVIRWTPKKHGPYEKLIVVPSQHVSFEKARFLIICHEGELVNV